MRRASVNIMESSPPSNIEKTNIRKHSTGGWRCNFANCNKILPCHTSLIRHRREFHHSIPKQIKTHNVNGFLGLNMQPTVVLKRVEFHRYIPKTINSYNMNDILGLDMQPKVVLRRVEFQNPDDYNRKYLQELNGNNQTDEDHDSIIDYNSSSGQSF